MTEVPAWVARLPRYEVYASRDKDFKWTGLTHATPNLHGDYVLWADLVAACPPPQEGITVVYVEGPQEERDMYQALRDAVAALGGIHSDHVPDSVRAALMEAASPSPGEAPPRHRDEDGPDDEPPVRPPG